MDEKKMNVTNTLLGYCRIASALISLLIVSLIFSTHFFRMGINF